MTGRPGPTAVSIALVLGLALGLVAVLLAPGLGLSSGSPTRRAGGGERAGLLPLLTEETFCPTIPSEPHWVVSTCPVNNFNATNRSTSFVVVGLNLSSPETVTVQNSARSTYTLLASLTNPPAKQGLWVFVADDVPAISWGSLWVNVSVATRIVVATLDIVNATDPSVGAQSSGAAGNSSLLRQSVASSDNDLLVLAAFGNMSLASTVCGFHGTLGVDGRSLIGEASGTYRNLEVGSLVNENGSNPHLQFHFGNMVRGGCFRKSTPHVGLLVSFRAA
jgi:hypothetical protein